MQLKCQSMDGKFKLGNASQTESMPIDSLLLNFILEGINLKRFSKESLALTQAMMFNFCFNRDEKRRSSKKKRYNHSKRTLFLLYVAIKIYSHSRIKAIIDSGSIFVLVSQYYTFG